MSDKKPWEETWCVTEYGSIADDGPPPYYWAGGFIAAGSDLADLADWAYDCTDEGKARAMLAAAAPDLARALLSVEWGHYGHETGELECPVCWAEKWEGHKPECAMAAALGKAGVIK